MVEQARLPWEEKAQESEPRRREPRAYRPWQIDEQTSQAARKGSGGQPVRRSSTLSRLPQTPPDAFAGR